MNEADHLRDLINEMKTYGVPSNGNPLAAMELVIERIVDAIANIEDRILELEQK